MAHQTHTESSRPAVHGVASSAFGPTDFGSDHHHKPTKTIVGVAILVVLSFVFYELGGKPAVHSSVPTHQTVASANR
jgi:hypothetical protein